MRRFAVLWLLAAVLVTGCAGAVRARYRVVQPDQLPADLANWKTLLPDQVDVRDAVIGSDVYIRLALGSCPYQDLKVTEVYNDGYDLIVHVNPGRPGESAPVIYLRVDWKSRVIWDPRTLTITSGDSNQHFWPEQPYRATKIDPTALRPTMNYHYQGTSPYACK